MSLEVLSFFAQGKSPGDTNERPYLGKLLKATFIVVYNFNPVLRLRISPLQRLAKWG